MLIRVLSKISRDAADEVYKILEEIREAKQVDSAGQESVPIIV